MKKQFQNLDIQCWEHTGLRLGFNQPEICLQAAPEGCGVLLVAVDELLADDVPSRRKLTLNPCERRKACTTIRLLLSPVTDDLKQMSLTRVGDTAVLEFTPVGLRMFRDAILAWQDGSEDFSVHPRSTARRNKDLGQRDVASVEVWFWTPSTDP